MFGYAVKHHSKKATLSIENGQNLTPLTLASKLGRNDIFKEIIELQSIVGDITMERARICMCVRRDVVRCRRFGDGVTSCVPSIHSSRSTQSERTAKQVRLSFDLINLLPM